MESLAPFLQGTCTPYNMPVYPGAQRIIAKSLIEESIGIDMCRFSGGDRQPCQLSVVEKRVFGSSDVVAENPTFEDSKRISRHKTVYEDLCRPGPAQPSFR